ncbi:UNVERIFIED_CONTAM: hypothetical protein NCL1_23324 [Trichonephila clavipes]
MQTKKWSTFGVEDCNAHATRALYQGHYLNITWSFVYETSVPLVEDLITRISLTVGMIRDVPGIFENGEDYQLCPISIPGFQACDEDLETWMACDADDCGFQMLNYDEIVTSVQEESDPVDDEMDEDEDNTTKVARVHQMLTHFLR